MDFNIEEIKQFIRNTSPSTEIFIGTDSERYKRKDNWYADYTTAIVIHYDGCRGCKVFGKIETEKDFDQRRDKPVYRLMNEVMKTTQMYLELAECIEDRHFEIHLDINPDVIYGSSCVVQQAIGYVRGMCGIEPMIKPNAPAASYCADRLKEILNYKEVA